MFGFLSSARGSVGGSRQPFSRRLKLGCRVRLCASDPCGRVRGDPTLDPTPWVAERARELDPAVFRCYGASKITASAAPALKLLVGRERPPEGLPPLSGPLDWGCEEGRDAGKRAHSDTGPRSAA